MDDPNSIMEMKGILGDPSEVQEVVVEHGQEVTIGHMIIRHNIYQMRRKRAPVLAGDSGQRSNRSHSLIPARGSQQPKKLDNSLAESRSN